MYTTNYNIARKLSNYIKNHPVKLNDCTAKLANKFMLRLDLPPDEIDKFRSIYQFIFMYSLITQDLNTVQRMTRNSKTIITIIDALIINGNLKIRQNNQLIDVMIQFGRTHSNDLASHNTITLCCLYFNVATFYNAIEYVSKIYCDNYYKENQL